MRADLIRALGVCRVMGWGITFTEATKRAMPDTRLAELAAHDQRKSG